MLFGIGDRVRTRARGDGHTRLPRYLECRSGTVTAVIGEFVLPDAYVRDHRESRRDTLYTVAFSATNVFPDATAATICADLFETYLEADR